MGCKDKLTPDTEEFLRLLPELRLAFGYFTPLETDRIASKAAALHGKKAADLLEGKASPEEYAYGETLDSYARKQTKNGPAVSKPEE